MREVPLKRMGRPDEIAGTVAWLLSVDAIGVTWVWYVGPAAGAVIAATVYELLYLRQPSTDAAASAS